MMGNTFPVETAMKYSWDRGPGPAMRRVGPPEVGVGHITAGDTWGNPAAHTTPAGPDTEPTSSPQRHSVSDPMEFSVNR